MIKIFTRLGIIGNFNLIKEIYKNPTNYSTTEGESPNALPEDKNKARLSALPRA